MVASRENFPLLAELLADQQRLDTPVARFASAHAASSGSQLSTLSSQLLPQLIPLTKPRPGEQYAFEVDLDSCTGCKSCVAACHSLNGLDETETWRDVGMLVSEDRAHPFTQTVTTACHHCADPGCLNGCPVLAYDKDPVTGIVVHLDDQCIGCSYCVLKCPYDVPKFSERLGIVRKCDMCHGRLAAGEAPACAQACPTHAIRIVTVAVPASSRTSVPDALSPAGTFLPGAPAPDYTQPTTRYLSKRPLPPGLAAADAAALRVQPAHWPLALMLTAMPAAVGFATVAALVESTAIPAIRLSWLLGASGLGASVFHLGQPLRAWRLFLGWRRSWLSREALLFGLWFGLASAALVVPAFAPASAAVGGIALFCSAMIYVDTRRRFWRAAQTFPRFFGTAAVCAAAFPAPAIAALLLAAKLAWEARAAVGDGMSARLQRGPLRRLALLRAGLGAATVALLAVTPGPWVLLPLLAGELAERLVFFRAVDAPKMPGVPAA